MEKEEKVIRERFKQEETLQDKKYFLDEIQKIINELYKELEEKGVNLWN